jgi:hypothetical protein
MPTYYQENNNMENIFHFFNLLIKAYCVGSPNNVISFALQIIEPGPGLRTLETDKLSFRSSVGHLKSTPAAPKAISAALAWPGSKPDGGFG